MWFDRLTSERSRGSRGKDSSSKRRPMIVVNARLRDKQSKWAPQLGWVLLVLLAVGIALVLVWQGLRHVGRGVFTENKDYMLTNLVVVCRNPALTAEVLKLESRFRGTNLFLIPIKDIRERLSRRPNVKSATVSICLPHKMEIEITERCPVARLGNPRDAARDLVVDDEGGVFLQKERNLLTVVTGYGETKISPGDKIKAQVKDALTLLSFCAGSPVGQRIKILSVDIRKENLELRLEEGPKVLLEWSRDVSDIDVQNREIETRLELLVATIWRASQAGVTLQSVDLIGPNPGRCVTVPRVPGGGE